MSLRQLPNVQAKAPVGIQWDTRSDVITKWDASLVSAESKDATITIYDVIGENWEGNGVTAKRVSAALRSIGDREITVSINSPGGDFFEGIAIYNLLREHPHQVIVKVVGLAASAASIIAMAGDEIQVAKTGFLMIHNAWVFAIGNRHDLRAAADTLDGFDTAMASLYADVSGQSIDEVTKLMDAESWISGEKAIEMGFATALLDADQVAIDGGSDGSSNAAIRKVDNLLAKQGLPRSERRELLKTIKGMSGAAPVTPGADLLREINSFTKQLRGER